MELDRKHSIMMEGIAAANKQPAEDVTQLRKLWTNMKQTEAVLLRAVAAYNESRRLLELVQLMEPERIDPDRTAKQLNSIG